MKQICLILCVLIMLLPMLSACAPSVSNGEIPQWKNFKAFERY